MERLLQYLDDLEDLFYAIPLLAERFRSRIKRIVFLLGSMGLQTAGVLLALHHPPIASAVAALLLVGLLYRATVIPFPRRVAAQA